MKSLVLTLLLAMSSFSLANQAPGAVQASAKDSMCTEICDIISDGWFDRVYCVLECEFYNSL